MRTTIRLDDQLLRDAKQLAARTGRTLTAVIEDALRRMLARPKEAKKPKQIRLPRADLGELRPGVNLDNNAELLDLMDETDAAR